MGLSVGILNKIKIIIINKKNTGFPRYFLDRVIFINFPSQGLLVFDAAAAYTSICIYILYVHVHVHVYQQVTANHLIYNFIRTSILDCKFNVPSTPKMSITYIFYVT